MCWNLRLLSHSNYEFFLGFFEIQIPLCCQLVSYFKWRSLHFQPAMARRRFIEYEDDLRDADAIVLEGRGLSRSNSRRSIVYQYSHDKETQTDERVLASEELASETLRSVQKLSPTVNDICTAVNLLHGAQKTNSTAVAVSHADLTKKLDKIILESPQRQEVYSIQDTNSCNCCMITFIFVATFVLIALLVTNTYFLIKNGV